MWKWHDAKGKIYEVVRHRPTNITDIFSSWQIWKIHWGRRRERRQKKQLSLNWKCCQCSTHRFNFELFFFLNKSRVLGRKSIWNKILKVSFWKSMQNIQNILACGGFFSKWNSTKSRKSIDYFHGTESASFNGKHFSFKYLSKPISKRDILSWRKLQ